MTAPSQPFVVPTDFDGPIGLLVELIERRQIQVTSISLERLTAEYLERVAAMSTIEPGALAEFVQLGSRLTYIKSLALLPGPTDQAREELSALETELAEYRRYRQAAETLAVRLREIRTWPRGHHTEVEQAVPTLHIELDALAAAFQAALRRTKPLPITAVLRRHLDIKHVMQQLSGRLRQGNLSLQHLVDDCADRLEIIVTFLAVLELLKAGELTAKQNGHFTDVELAATGAIS